MAILPSSISNPKLKKEIHSIFQDSGTEESYLCRLRTLEEERDEERRMLEEKLAEKEKNINAKIVSIDKTQPNTPFKPNR